MQAFRGGSKRVTSASDSRHSGFGLGQGTLMDETTVDPPKD